MIQIGFGPFPIIVVDDFLETRLHTGRDTFVAAFGSFVAFGTILDNGLDALMQCGILLFQIFEQDASKD